MASIRLLWPPVFLPGVCSGQSAVCRGSDDLKGRAQSVEPSWWKLGRPCGELQQTCQLLLGEAGHHCPEPLHHLKPRQTFSDGVLLPENQTAVWKDVLSLWSATILQQSQRELWSPARWCHPSRTSTADEMKEKHTVWRHKRQQDLTTNITRTSNSFSSNMASRFSGTSSFRPAIDEEVTIIRCTLGKIFNWRYWHRVMERSCTAFFTFQEVFHLIPHLAGQSVLSQQVQIMHLVLICNSDLSSARDQLHHLQDSRNVENKLWSKNKQKLNN